MSDKFEDMDEEQIEEYINSLSEEEINEMVADLDDTGEVQIDELSQKMVRAYRDKAGDSKSEAEDEKEYYSAHGDNTDDEDNTIAKRSKGIKLAGKKIRGNAKVNVKDKEGTNMDEEQIDELSINKLAAYDKKATKQMNQTRGTYLPGDQKTYGKRDSGTLLAQAKLRDKVNVKEDTQEMNDDINEGSAADTLKPMGAPGESKAEMLATFTTLLAQLGKEDLSDLFNRTIDSIGSEAQNIPADASAQNMATIATKSAVKEDIADMFAGDDLTEEMKEKAATIFEAAINTRINLEIADLEEQLEERVALLDEEYENRLQEAASSIFEDVSDKLDKYLDYVTEQWMEENQLAIENSIRAEIAEDFIGGLHNLFAEHYIQVPEERVDIFAEMKNEIANLKNSLNETIDEKLELEAILEEASKDAIFEEVSDGLALTQSEKLRTLSEGIDFVDSDVYKRKLEIIKENYFTAKKTSVKTGLITEEIDGINEDNSGEEHVPAHMQQYVKAITKSLK